MTRNATESPVFLTIHHLRRTQTHPQKPGWNSAVRSVWRRHLATPTLDQQAGEARGLHALDLKSGASVWSAKASPCSASKADCSPAQSAAVTAIPGVVFADSVDGHLRTYSTATGSGYGEWGGMPGNVLLAFSDR